MIKPLLSRILALMLLLLPAFNHAASPSEEMAGAAKAFLAGLTAEQRTKATYDFKNEERVNWHFVPKARNGLPLKEMTAAQQKLAHALMQTGLSQQGYQKATNIMLICEQVLREIENGAARRDTTLYFFTIFGDPDKAPWGWRVEGHHVALNFVVGKETQVTVTPTFYGSNPAEIGQGDHKGLRALAREEDLGRQLATSLNAEQQKVAIIATNAPRDIITGNARRANPLDPKGIAADKLTKDQQETLLALIKEYVFRFRTDVAEQDLKKIQAAGFEKIYFAWAGPLERGQGHYYRIQGPTFLMEYDNTQNRANHVHTVWRDFENDFGEDLLRKHYDETTHAH